MANVPIEREATEEHAAPRVRKRPWPVVAVMLLLLGQMAGHFALGIYLVSETDNLTIREVLEGGPEAFQVLEILGIIMIIGSGFFAILTILQQWRSAWHQVMFSQALSLILGLVLYFVSAPFYSYLILVYAVFVVVYLLLPGVHVAFLPIEDKNNGTR
ncbi:MAG TPA: hypothetical protein PLD57_05440 [Aggregatilineales bacterium]|nr:hypothetical protein [Aggregatilineales bacterium]HPV06489.1 hypothetical protein [Aggregatilineales bacterium]HQE17752.1 hypothetical protein [Aggregatilineales bacterium]